MSLIIREKWPKKILMFYLALAIIGTFAFSIGQTFSYENSNQNNLSSIVYISSTAHTIDWLAEDTPTVNKAYKYSNSPLRNSLLRIFTLPGIISIALLLAKSHYKQYKNDNAPRIKNLVPLKLRI